MNVTETLNAVNEDGGTGALIHDPMAALHRFHIGTPRTILPIVRQRGTPETEAPPSTPAIGAIAPPSSAGDPSTEGNLENQAGLGNAGAWASAVSSLGASTDVLKMLQQSAGNGGANLQLGPQLGFAPAGDPGSSAGGGGGIGVFLILALAVVGALVYYHFRKRKGSSEAEKA